LLWQWQGVVSAWHILFDFYVVQFLQEFYLVVVDFTLTVSATKLVALGIVLSLGHYTTALLIKVREQKTHGSHHLGIIIY
jgi:hypothetical protein